MKQYDPKEVVCTWLGLDLLDGVNPDTFIEISVNAPRFSPPVVDREGEAARVKSQNRSGSVRITYLAKSSMLKKLSAIAIADDVGENQVGPMLVKDLNGNTLVTLLSAYLEDQPPPTYGGTLGNLTFVWHYVRRDQILTGHDDVAEGGTPQ